MLPIITKIYNKSDFTIQLPLAEGYDGQEFRFTIYTCGEIENGWVASYIDGVYTNCSVENDIVTIYVNNNNQMNPGCVTVQSEYDYFNSHFIDNEDNVKDVYKTNIYLVSYKTNAFSASFRPSNLPDLTDSSEYVTLSYLTTTLEDYVTDEELQSQLEDFVTEEDFAAELSNYITDEELTDMGFLTQSEIDQMGYATVAYLNEKLSSKQNLLVSGQNIKTINGYSLLGSGNIDITDAGSIDLSSYVTKDELDSMGYITSSDLVDELADYPTNNDLALTLQDYVSYSQFNTYTSDFVVDNDLQDYVTKSQLMQASYVTNTELSQAGYLVSIPSEYITESELSAMSYVTASQLPTKTSDLTNDSEFITSNELSQMGYITASQVPTPDMSAYVTKTELSNAGYVTSSDLSGFVTDTELSNVLSTASYVTSNELSQMGYITNSTLSQASYVTQQGLSAMGYITAAQVPTPDLSIYVTKTELSNASYVTQQGLSGMGYVTKTALSQMSYVTTSQLNTKQDTLVSGTNIKTINNQTLLGSGNITITSSGIISEVTQTEYDAMQQAGTLDPDTIYIITDAAPTDLSYYVLQSDLENMGYVTTSQLPNMNDYVSKTELDSMSYATTTQLNAKQNTLVSGTNIKTINNESLLGSGNITIQGSGEANVIESISVNGTTQTITNKNVDITVPTNTNQLTNGAGFLTSTIFQYDSSTNTLTISI